MRYALIVLLLAGCASPERRAEVQAKTDADRLARYSANCKKLGFDEGTQPFLDCRQKFWLADDSHRSMTCNRVGTATICN
jgi:hypothetical protein